MPATPRSTSRNSGPGRPTRRAPSAVRRGWEWVRHEAGARALFSGDPLAALSVLGEDRDPHALLLRGIALAQLSELEPARDLLERAVASFEHSGDTLSHARAIGALAEVAAAEREPGRAQKLLTRAARLLEDAGDLPNAAWATLVHARFRALLGDRPGAESLLAHVEELGAAGSDARIQAARGLLRAELALRSGDVGSAATIAAALARSPAAWAPRRLAGEIDALMDAMRTPIALVESGAETLPVDGLELAALFGGGSKQYPAAALVVDRLARRVLLSGGDAVDLGRRPVLFDVLVCLAARWPEDAPWRLIAREALGFRDPGESIRLRIKVEIDRLRAVLPRPAAIVACGNAWRLSIPKSMRVVRIAAPADDAALAGTGRLVSAFLADGAAWSSPALARAARCSIATVRRALADLSCAGAVTASGAGRARRYAAARPAGFASQMLLVGLLSGKRE